MFDLVAEELLKKNTHERRKEEADIHRKCNVDKLTFNIMNIVSPDGLIGEDGLIEIKSRHGIINLWRKTLIKYIWQMKL